MFGNNLFILKFVGCVQPLFVSIFIIRERVFVDIFIIILFATFDVLVEVVL